MKKIYKTLIITAIIILNTTIVWAKNSSITKGNIKLEIAKPVIDIEYIKTEADNEDVRNYYFKIKNYNENNETSQINQKYILKIKTNNIETLDLLNYKLYETNEEGEIQKNIYTQENCTEEIEIGGETRAEQYYKLSIKNNNENTNIQDEIFIQINSSSVNL